MVETNYPNYLWVFMDVWLIFMFLVIEYHSSVLIERPKDPSVEISFKNKSNLYVHETFPLSITTSL